MRRGIWHEPDPVAPEQSDVPVPGFHEFATTWFEARRVEGGRTGGGLTPAGEADLRWQLSNHLLPVFAHMRLDEISVEDVDRYRRMKVRERALNATSINKTITTLAAILELGMEYGHLSQNPAKGRRRRLPATRPARTYLDCADHIAALLDAAGDLDREGRSLAWRRALLAVLTLGGLRIDEALSLRWKHINLAAARIQVPGTKTHAAARVVDLLPLLRDELGVHAANARQTEPEALVFGTRNGAKQSATNVRRRVLAPAVTAANVKLSAAGRETLPRTFASVLIARGEDPAYVMAQMGHTTPNMTLSMYAQAMRRDDGERERLRSLVNGTGAADHAASLGTIGHYDPETASS